MPKVKLDENFAPRWRSSEPIKHRVMESLPFFTSTRSLLSHRVKAIVVYDWNLREWPRWDTEVYFLCGGTSTFNSNTAKSKANQYTLEESPSKLLCIRCEQAAENLGMESADDMLGFHVHTGKAQARQTCCQEKEDG